MDLFNKLATSVASVAVFAAVIPTSSAQAASVTLGFDEFNNGQTVSGDTYSDLGVIFDGPLGVFSLGTGALPQSGNNTVANLTPLFGDITGSFTETVDFISVFAGDIGNDTDTVTLLGFDEFDNLVASDTFTATAAQTLSISGAGITRFEINNVGFIAIDDFTFNKAGTTAAVPEPSIILGSLAVAGVGAASKRKKKAS